MNSEVDHVFVTLLSFITHIANSFFTYDIPFMALSLLYTFMFCKTVIFFLCHSCSVRHKQESILELIV